jgi:RNase H-like domain found in reverse transcriptase
MTDPESRYSTIERELLGLLDTLKYFRTASLNSKYPVLILTDRANLEHWNAYKPTRYRHYKWLETLSEFQISVAYIPGEKTILADLSSRPITKTSNNNFKENEYPNLLIFVHSLERCTAEEDLVYQIHWKTEYIHPGRKKTQRIIKCNYGRNVSAAKILKRIKHCPICAKAKSK